MDEELRELDRKISSVLEKEKQLLGIKQGESFASKVLMDKVMENKAMIGQVYNSINRLEEGLKNYIGVKTQREKRINELEKKIKAQAKQDKLYQHSKKDISLLKNKLKALEATYNILKNKGLDVSRVAEKIEDLKIRLN